MLEEGPIILLSKMHSSIAVSSIQVEYRGVVNATTQCLWLQVILGECGFELDFSTIIYCDNQSTIQICNYPVQRQRTKHIEIHMHYIRQLVHDGTIHLLFCSSSKQVVDIFTKFFCEKKFINLKSLLGISYCAVKHIMTIFSNFVLLSMFKGGFSHWVFASFLGGMDMQYVKG